MSGIEPSPYAKTRGESLARGPLMHSYATHLGVDAATLFAFISDFPSLPEWMPLINQASVDNRNAQSPGQVGSVRVIQATLGKPTLETVVAFEPGRLIAYSASDSSLMGMYRDHVGVLVTEPHREAGSVLTWLTYCNPGTAPMRWLGPPMFRWVISTSVKNLERRFPLSQAVA